MDISRGKIKRWMLKELNYNLKDYTDSAGEINCTKLAEEAADYFSQHHWLDDETHYVWDISVDVTADWERINRNDRK